LRHALATITVSGVIGLVTVPGFGTGRIIALVALAVTDLVYFVPFGRRTWHRWRLARRGQLLDGEAITGRGPSDDQHVRIRVDAEPPATFQRALAANEQPIYGPVRIAIAPHRRAALAIVLGPDDRGTSSMFERSG
jgi:hypothetical protein